MEIGLIGLVFGVAIIAAWLGVMVYRRGVIDGAAGGEKAAQMPARARKNAPQIDPEIEKLNKILQNVEKYDGSALGQSKIDD